MKSKVSTVSSETKFLRKRFERQWNGTVTDFIRERQSELTLETYTAVLNRGSKAALRTLLIMLADLRCTSEEFANILSARGEKTLAMLFKADAPSAEERQFLDKLRVIGDDEKKKKLVADLLESFA